MRENHGSAASCTPLTGDGARTSGLCPDRESNRDLLVPRSRLQVFFQNDLGWLSDRARDGPCSALGSCLHVSPANGSESEEEQSAVTAGSPALTGTHWAPDSRFHPGHTKMDAIRRGSAKDSQRHKVHSGAQSTVTQNFSSETKQDTEYGPCRREMEDTLNQLKSLSTLSPQGIHLPNCDRKGFYKRKQCRPSKGRKRGFCWCVDKYGQPLPGHDPRGRADVHCDGVESL